MRWPSGEALGSPGTSMSFGWIRRRILIHSPPCTAKSMAGPKRWIRICPPLCTFTRVSTAIPAILGTKPVRVQEVAPEGRLVLDLRRAPVQRVAGHGVPDARKMYADLMGAPGADPHFQEREALEPAQHPVFRPGRPSRRQTRRHARA